MMMKHGYCAWCSWRICRGSLGRRVTMLLEFRARQHWDEKEIQMHNPFRPLIGNPAPEPQMPIVLRHIPCHGRS